MIKISYRLKEPQTGISNAKQKETLIYLFFSYGYYETNLQGAKKYSPLKLSTGEKILPYLWNDEPKRMRRNNEVDFMSFNTRLDNFEALIKRIYNASPNSTHQSLKKLIDEGRNGTKWEALNLNQYLEKFVIDIYKDIRVNEDKQQFSITTKKGFKSFVLFFTTFQAQKKRKYNFNDITMDFYNDFTAYMVELNYSPNYIGSLIRKLKKIMRLAKLEGLHNNTEYENRAFKAFSIEVDNIYLTETELRKLSQIDLSNKRTLDIARDIFLVGCYTAQRYSDYSKINANNIKGNFIELNQSKEKVKVIIPIRPELNEILNKYENKLPKTHGQKVNKLIKEVGKLAGINEMVEIEEIKGGFKLKKVLPKYELITTHTARRTGATNMYLAGIKSIDIMKITGHKTEGNFLKYIKVSKEETALLLSSHPYFNHPILKAN